MTARVPWALQQLRDSWLRVGDEQPGVAWRRPAWERYFPDATATLASYPDVIGRSDLLQRCRAITDETTATVAFIATMIWGFGTSDRRGAWKTSEIVSAPGAPQILLDLAFAARTGPPIAAFNTAADSEHRIHRLGPAFFTKFLCFCSLADVDTSSTAPDDRVVPILDKRLAVWVAAETGVFLDSQERRARSFVKYLSLLTDWGNQLGLRVDLIEELIFRSTDNDPALPLRAGWPQDEIAMHRAIETIRYQLAGRGELTDLAALDQLERSLFARVESGATRPECGP